MPEIASPNSNTNRDSTWENFGGDTFFSLPHHHQADIA
jgi:hypothetical protein